MLLKLQAHLQQNFPFLKEKKLLIAISGGIDSMVLMHLFYELKYNISLAHCNFKLRGLESDLDEQFVIKTAGQYNVPIYHIQFSTQEYCQQNKVNTQLAARELRYNWFQKICKEYQCDFILTAHHLNDVMETFLINLSRGTGIDGLASIPAINQNIVRPLLVFSRKEIETYAAQSNIDWREDKSNAETKYLRNKIRHHITPELYRLHPNFEQNFLNTTKNIYESKAFIANKINLLKKDVFKQQGLDVIVEKELLAQLSEFEIYQLFKPFGFQSSKAISQLVKAQSGKQLYTDTHVLLSNRTCLVISENKQYQQHTNEYIITHLKDTYHLPIPLKISTAVQQMSKNCIAINDTENIFPLYLRKWKDGDFFYPTGMQGKKKVSKYFKDEKLSLRDKESTWLLCNHQQKIIWIVGHRADRVLTQQSSSKNLLFICV